MTWGFGNVRLVGTNEAFGFVRSPMKWSFPNDFGKHFQVNILQVLSEPRNCSRTSGTNVHKERGDFRKQRS